MTLLERLKNNKGTVSSALGKELARKILEGDSGLLKDAVPLVCYSLKNKEEKVVRSGAAKIVECVAEEKPELVAPFLESLLPALETDEPQTRWMVFRTMGFCASLRADIAKRTIPYAKKYIYEKAAGQLCLVSSIDLFLGDYGAASEEQAEAVFPLLIESSNNAIENEHDWLLESFIKIAKHLGKKDRLLILDFAGEFENHPRKTTRERLMRIREECR